MSRRGVKQLIYGALFLAIIALIAYGLYAAFLKPAPPPCQTADCAVPGTSAKPIEIVGDVTILHPAGGRTTLVAKIQNPNTDLAAAHFDYRFTLYDSSTTVPRVVQGESYIYAGEIKYLAEFLEGNDVVQATRAELVIENVDWRAAQNRSRPNATLQDSRTDIATSTVTITGKVANNDASVLSDVTILALFRGRFGEIVAASMTTMQNLAPGESRSFSISHPPLPEGASREPTLIIYARQP